MKKFKTKRKKKKYLIYITIIIVTYMWTIKTLSNIKLESSNEEFIESMLNNVNTYELYKETDYTSIFMKYVLNLDLTNPKEMLESIFKYKKVEAKEEAKYIENEIDKPYQIYIYNTHETESYNALFLKEHNINPDVKMAANLLKGLLERDNIKTLVEEGSMAEYLNNNNLDYNESYLASRYYLENVLKENNDLKLIIDLHRDSVDKDKTTVNIDGKNYAKVLFVVGLNNEHYEENYALSELLNEKINSKYPNLSRGILIRNGKGNKARYNQDLSNKIILIECGGVDNTIDEVMNTVIVLKEIIKEYLGEI